ncbi:hypothetical protein BDV93DRAFT_561481 [Ceratobasidium sp. AG-I]|nr:hypothetical protein BDV93DRAFT_561481 [Ceratobasidium sp. AG-I]
MPICPCCDRELSDRQIRRHLQERQLEIQAFLDALDEDNGPDLDDIEVDEGGEADNDEYGADGPGFDDGLPLEGGVAPDEVEVALGHARPDPALAPAPGQANAPLGWPDINLEDLIALEDMDDRGGGMEPDPDLDFDGMDLDDEDEDDLFVPHPGKRVFYRHYIHSS